MQHSGHFEEDHRKDFEKVSKVDTYKDVLKDLPDWDEFLLKESGLPGPRANLELMQAVVDLGTEETFIRYLKLNLTNTSDNNPEEFLAFCGTVGLGKLIVEGKTQYLSNLRFLASSKRWRIREGVAIALQLIGESDINLLLREMETWKKGNLLERRAVVAALCEPKLLTQTDTVRQVLRILDEMTKDLSGINDRQEENFKILRKALGYAWSVAVAAAPQEGKDLMEKWLWDEDKDIRWIMKENLRKNRLIRTDRQWTTKWKQTLGVK